MDGMYQHNFFSSSFMPKNQFNYSWSWINWLPDHYFRFSEERLTFETRDLSDILQIYFLSTIDHPLISLNLYFRFPSFPSRIISNPAHAVTVWKTHITFSYHQGSLPIWLKLFYFHFPWSLSKIIVNPAIFQDLQYIFFSSPEVLLCDFLFSIISILPLNVFCRFLFNRSSFFSKISLIFEIQQ